MARSNTVKVSDEELSALHTARQEIFGSDNVAFGEVIRELSEGPNVFLRNAQSGGPKIDITYNDGRYCVGTIYPRKSPDCGEQHEDYIYWNFNGETAETLANQPNRDDIDLTVYPTDRSEPTRKGDGYTILITGAFDENSIPFNSTDDLNNGRRVIFRPVGESGDNVRGLAPDTIIMLTDVPDDIMENVLKPTGAHIVQNY